jgi:hypothetical protein
LEELNAHVKIIEINIAELACGSSNLLRHYATNRKVAGSSPDEVDIFN